MTMASRFLKSFQFGTEVWDPSHRFETSWLLPPWALFSVRLLFGLYIITVQLVVLGNDCAVAALGGCAEARASFSYFTILTYWGLGFYMLVAAAHTATYALSGGRAALLDSFPRPLQALHALFYTTVTTYPFIVTVVYWAVLYPGTWFALEFQAFSNVSQHGLNSAFALAEILLPRTAPPPLAHALWLIVVLALYLALAYVTHATKGFYVYTFLDPANGSGALAAYIVGIAVGCLVVFALVYALVWARRYVTETVLGMEGKFAGPSSSRRTSDGGTEEEGKVVDLEMARLRDAGN